MAKYLVLLAFAVGFTAGVMFRGSLILEQTVNNLLLQDNQRFLLRSNGDFIVKGENTPLPPDDPGGISLPGVRQ